MIKILSLMLVSLALIFSGCDSEKPETVAMNYQKALMQYDYDGVKENITKRSLAEGTLVLLIGGVKSLSPDKIEGFKKATSFIDDFQKKNPNWMKQKKMDEATINLLTSDKAHEALEYLKKNWNKKLISKEIISGIKITATKNINPELKIFKLSIPKSRPSVVAVHLNSDKEWKVVLLSELSEDRKVGK